MNDASSLLSASFLTLTPPSPDGGVLRTEGPERTRAIANSKHPAGCLVDSPSIRNGNAGSGGTEVTGSDFPSLPPTLVLFFRAPNHTPGLLRFQNIKTSIFFPLESFEDVPDKLRITLYPQTKHRTGYTQARARASTRSQLRAFRLRVGTVLSTRP